MRVIPFGFRRGLTWVVFCYGLRHELVAARSFAVQHDELRQCQQQRQREHERQQRDECEWRGPAILEFEVTMYKGEIKNDLRRRVQPFGWKSIRSIYGNPEKANKCKREAHHSGVPVQSGGRFLHGGRTIAASVSFPVTGGPGSTAKQTREK